jgi:endonuclease G
MRDRHLFLTRFSAALALTIGGCLPSSAASDGDFQACRDHVLLGAPGGGGTALCRLGFALSFNGATKVADWTSTRLTAAHLVTRVGRSDDFRVDSDLAPDQRARRSDYRGSGYDRGHLVPAAAMAWHARAMSESFLLSNIAPQVGPGFNRGIWRRLETSIRRWVRRRGSLIVVTGPLFEATPIERIGDGAVAVPSHFFKIAYDPARTDAIAFILPNERISTPALTRYLVSIDEVERRSGLDFFARLDDGTEAALEAQVQPAPWPTTRTRR